MKKISQAIIGATLILDVAVVFTFGLAVISSFEDGSRLPEMTFVRKSSEGRVAGTMTTNTLSATHIYLNYPVTNGETLSGLKILKAKTNSDVHSVKFTIKRISNGAIGDMTATRVTGTILDWNREIDTAQMPNEPHSITAKAFSIDGTLLATSQTITVSILNSSTTSDNTTTTPSVTLNSPTAVVLSGPVSISGTLSNFPTSYSLPIKELQVWQGTTLKSNFSLIRDANNSNNLTGSMDTNTLVNGDYILKIHLSYNDGISYKALDSGPINITVSNANTVGDNPIAQPVPSIALSAPLGGTISGPVSISGTLSNFPTSYSLPIKELQVWQGTTLKNNFPLTREANGVIGSMDTTTLVNGDYTIKIHLEYNDGISNKTLDSGPVSVTVNNANTATSSDTPTDTSSTSSASTDSTTSTTDNTSTGTSGSTGTTTPPPAGTTATTVTVAITNPAPSTTPVILRSKDNPLAAKTSAAVSGLKFIVHKSGEPADWITPITAGLTDGINWKAIMNLTDFKDGAYDITAVSGDIKNNPVNVIVQKFSFKWLTPNKGDELSKKAVLKAEINGIYGIDNKVPMSDIVVEFWQVSVTSSYPPKYIGRAQKKLDFHEWFYEWNTTDSPPGECRLEVRIGNAAYSTIKGSLYNTEPLLVKVSNQISSVSLSGSSNSNANQNSNTPSSVNSNTTNVNNAVNSAINSSTNLNQNTNTAAALNSNLNSAQDALNLNLAVTDTAPAQTDSDNDKLSDEKEAQLGTNSNSNDSDGDGLFDREEVEVHGTNPLNVDSDGDGYNDFEEIQSGHNPLVKPTDSSSEVLLKQKPIEEPKNVEKPISKELIVDKEVENKEVAIIPQPLTPGVEGEEPTPEILKNIFVLKGKGPANTILHLYIYSDDPIVVTVRTNENGEWIYELDKTLEDGEHEVYATITDDTGKIESTSSPMRFLVKQARAETIPERADTGIDSVPGSSSTNLYLLISGIMVFIAIVAGFIIALRRKRGDTNQMT